MLLAFAATALIAVVAFHGLDRAGFGSAGRQSNPDFVRLP
jgi:hypothetical protein